MNNGMDQEGDARMCRKLSCCLLILFTAGGTLLSQTISHPWKVVDQGSGKSAGGQLILHSSIGQTAVQRMVYIDTGMIVESGFIPGIRTLNGTTTTTQIPVEPNWNLLSLPLMTSEYHPTLLFPTSQSQAFVYQNGYQPKDSLVPGKGFWLKYDQAKTLCLRGTAISADTVDVATKWNIIGCISYPVPVNEISPLGTTITSQYFGFTNSGGYEPVSTLEPGKGYWIKVSANGSLVLRPGTTHKNDPETDHE